MAIETLKSAKTETPIFDGGVLRGRCCNYSISFDGLFSIEFTLNISVDYILFGTGSENQNHIDNNDIFNGILEYSEKDKLLHASTVLKKLADIIDNEI